MSMVRLLRESDLEQLESLFAQYPHKRVQQKFQQIDESRLAQFFAQAEAACLRKAPPEELRRWVIDRNGAPAALAGLQEDNWHSRFYPYRFARLAPLLVADAPPEGREDLLDTVLAEAYRWGRDFLTARIDAAERELLGALLMRGFYLVECSVKVSGRIAQMAPLAPPSRAVGMTIRPAEAGDVAMMQRIAASSHPHNHYYNDPNLPRESTNGLFTSWVERCMGNPSARVFVVDKRGRPCGFTIYLIPEALNKALRTQILILDFVCLSSDARGSGIGRWLISQTVRMFQNDFRFVELRTGQTNYEALACYESLGMRTIGCDFLLHRAETIINQE